MKLKRIVQLVGGATMCAVVASASAALPYPRITTTIKYIESRGTDAVIHMSRDVDNTQSCAGVDSDTPSTLRSFYIDYSTPDGKSNYVLIMAAATARKRTQFQVSGCDAGTGLPQITAVEVTF